MPDRPLTLKELIHELSAGYTIADEPVLVGGWDSAGNYEVSAAVGISVRSGRDGKPVQSLKLCPADGGSVIVTAAEAKLKEIEEWCWDIARNTPPGGLGRVPVGSILALIGSEDSDDA